MTVQEAEARVTPPRRSRLLSRKKCLLLALLFPLLAVAATWYLVRSWHSAKQNEQFETIIRFYQEQQDRHPTIEFNRTAITWNKSLAPAHLHIPVPKLIEPYYQFGFDDSFLNALTANQDHLRRKVAVDLIYMKRPLLSTYDGECYGLECTYYVVVDEVDESTIIERIRAWCGL